MFVTVDWDFFIRNAGEADREGISRSEKGEIHNFFLYDWGHTETHSLPLQDLLWSIRGESFERMGFDIEAEMSLQTDLDSFAEWIQSPLEVSCTDSHVHGFEAASRAQALGSDEIVSFDAHCDLGYDPDKVKREIKKGVCDCGSWLLHALRLNLADRATIVYPDWKGLVEWEGMREFKHIAKLADRIDACTYSEWVARNEPLYPNVLHFCRSSAWTPPFHDEAFDRLVGKYTSDRLPVRKWQKRLILSENED